MITHISCFWDTDHVYFQVLFVCRVSFLFVSLYVGDMDQPTISIFPLTEQRSTLADQDRVPRQQSWLFVVDLREKAEFFCENSPDHSAILLTRWQRRLLLTKQIFNQFSLEEVGFKKIAIVSCMAHDASLSLAKNKRMLTHRNKRNLRIKLIIVRASELSPLRRVDEDICLNHSGH